MQFNIRTQDGTAPANGEYIVMHGIGLMLRPVPGGYEVSHYETGLAIAPLHAISDTSDPVGFQEAKDGIGDMFAVHPEMRANIVTASAGRPEVNTLPTATSAGWFFGPKP